jgi:glutaredoxin 3
MEQRSGRFTVPQIWIGGRHVGGCDELYALERGGELDRMLETARI